MRIETGDSCNWATNVPFWTRRDGKAKCEQNLQKIKWLYRLSINKENNEVYTKRTKCDNKNMVCKMYIYSYYTIGLGSNCFILENIR